MFRIGIIAGEVSGDLLGAGLMRSVLEKESGVIFEGIAGPQMQEAGCKAWFQADELAVMGITEVFKDLPRLLSIKKHVVQRWLENPPDLFIGIDAPDFNLRVAKILKLAGIHTMHYVSPSVWAWREGRVKGIEKAIDDLFCLLPFEPDYYSNTTVNAHFVGHPMADKIELSERDSQPCPDGAIGENMTCKIAILPGSRQGEINKLAQPFLQAVHLLASRFPNAEFTVPAAKEKLIPELEKYAKDYAPGVPVKIVNGNAGDVLKNSDIALIASGTATLEAMLHHCPMVVGYRMAGSTAALLNLSKAIKTKYFALPNILANEMLVPEIMQNELSPQRLFVEVKSLIENFDQRKAMQNRFVELHKVLKQNTNEQVANIVIDNLNSKRHATN